MSTTTRAGAGLQASRGEQDRSGPVPHFPVRCAVLKSLRCQSRTSTHTTRAGDAAVVLDDDHVGVLLRIIHDQAPSGLTVTERILAEEIDCVVTRALAR